MTAQCYFGCRSRILSQDQSCCWLISGPSSKPHPLAYCPLRQKQSAYTTSLADLGGFSAHGGSHLVLASSTGHLLSISFRNCHLYLQLKLEATQSSRIVVWETLSSQNRLKSLILPSLTLVSSIILQVLLTLSSSCYATIAVKTI